MNQKSTPISLLIALFVALCALAGPGLRTARADDEVSPNFFYDALAPYGEWVDVGDYGSCWHPTGVDADWAPYTDGYWAYTDAGWTWVSYEDFGGIVYHYGRWMRVEGEGWCWAPDYEWAPAWVSWRSNDDYVGWAPLPPEARWRGDIGFSVWVDSAYDIGPGYYSFCRFRDFGAPVLRGVIVNRDENFALIGRTRNITNTTYSNFGGARVVFNGGPNFAALRGVTAHAIPALKLVQNSRFDPAQIRGGGVGKLIASRTVGNQLIVAAPLVSAPADPNFFKGRAKRFIEPGKVTKGWSGVKDPAARQELKQQIQAQTKGVKPETAHARPVAAAELQVVPANPNAADPATGKARVRMEKATPSTATATQAVRVPVAPVAPVVPQVNPFVEKPVAGSGQDPRRHGKATPAAAVVAQPAVPVAPAGGGGQKVARVNPVEKERAAAVQSQKDAGRAVEIQREKEREAIVKQQRPPEVEARGVQPPPRVAPHEEVRPGRPTPAPANAVKKGSVPPGKDKDKDKDRNGN